MGSDLATIGGLVALRKAGEERLLEATLSGKVPLSVAAEIAKAEGAEMQRELLKAYEAKQLSYSSIRAVKRLMDQRRNLGKQRGSNGQAAHKRMTSADSLVNAYRRESQRQTLMVKTARVCEATLLFVGTALRKLTADENFLNLLRAEALATIPKDTWERLQERPKEVA